MSQKNVDKSAKPSPSGASSQQSQTTGNPTSAAQQNSAGAGPTEARVSAVPDDPGYSVHRFINTQGRHEVPFQEHLQRGPQEPAETKPEKEAEKKAEKKK